MFSNRKNDIHIWNKRHIMRRKTKEKIHTVVVLITNIYHIYYIRLMHQIDLSVLLLIYLKLSIQSTMKNWEKSKYYVFSDITSRLLKIPYKWKSVRFIWKFPWLSIFFLWPKMIIIIQLMWKNYTIDAFVITVNICIIISIDLE